MLLPVLYGPFEISAKIANRRDAERFKHGAEDVLSVRGRYHVPSLPFSRCEPVLSPLLAYLKHISLGQTGKISGEKSKYFCGTSRK